MSEKVTLVIAAGVDFQGKEEDRTKPFEPVCKQTQTDFYFIFWGSEQFGETFPFMLIQFLAPLSFFFLLFESGTACGLPWPLLRTHGRACGKHICFSRQTLLQCSPHDSVFQDGTFGSQWPFEPGHKILAAPMETTTLVLEADGYQRLDVV